MCRAASRTTACRRAISLSLTTRRTNGSDLEPCRLASNALRSAPSAARSLFLQPGESPTPSSVRLHPGPQNPSSRATSARPCSKAIVVADPGRSPQNRHRSTARAKGAVVQHGAGRAQSAEELARHIQIVSRPPSPPPQNRQSLSRLALPCSSQAHLHTPRRSLANELVHLLFPRVTAVLRCGSKCPA